MVTLLDALSGKPGKLATVADLYQAKAILVLGADLAREHPLLSFQVRANYRHHQAHIYAVTPEPVREDKYAAAVVRRRPKIISQRIESLREKLGRAGAGRSCSTIPYKATTSARWWMPASRWASR